MTKKVYDGFTKKELDQAFDLIKFPSGDWRDPIQARVLKKDNQDAWDEYYYIKADGYYLSMVH